MRSCLLIIGLINIAFASKNASSQLVEKAVQITNKYYKNRFATSVVWAYNDSEEVSDFLSKCMGSVVLTPIYDVNNNDTILNTIENVGYWQSVFFATEPETFDKFMSIINEHVRQAIRLVLVFEKPIKDILELSIFMKIAWKNELVNIVVLSKDYTGEIIISTYYPYSNGNCENHLPVQLDQNENMFPNKFRNFNKCPIRVSALFFIPYVDVNNIKFENGTITEMGGYDGITLSVIAYTLNATLDIKIDINNGDYGSYSEGNATGGFADLVHKKADILFPAGLLTLGRYSVTQSTHAYHFSDIRWIGPKRREIYNGLKLLFPFISIVTPVLCLTFIIFVIIALVIKKRDKYSNERKKNIGLQTFVLLLGQTVNFETKMTLLNTFFMIWIWFTFIVRIAYQGELVQSLENELLEPPFETLEDALTRVNGYGGHQIISEYFKDTPFEHNYKILGILDIRHYLESIAVGERFLIADDTFLVQHIRHSLQIFDTQIGSAATCIYLRPRWPAAQMIDSIVVHLVESGITEHIRTSKFAVSRKEINDAKVQHALNMKMLCACFYGLGVMSVLCSVIFIVEIMYAKYTCVKCQ